MTPQFLVDGMLGSLARWLRICGYDTEYRRDTEDDKLIEEAEATGRILLTRDRMLSIIAGKRDVESILVKGSSDYEELGCVALKLGLKLNASDSRCSKCNSEIINVQKEEVRGKVPINSYKAFEDFWVCEKCDTIYWRGGHWENIKSTINKAREIAKNNTSQQSL